MTKAAGTKSQQRVCVLVLGMHRSGTSALTRVLNLVGCDLPKTIMGSNKTNEAGHWESTPIARLNDRILQSAGSEWDDWLEFNPGWFNSPKVNGFREEAIATLDEEFNASRLFVLKDPRICRLAPFWIETLEHAGIRPLAVIPIRNPIEVAASLEQRNGFVRSYGYLLWLRHVLDAELATRGMPRYFTSYDRLLTGWPDVLKEADSALGISWPRMSGKVTTEVDIFLSEKYRHHREPPERVLENPALSTWLRHGFTIFNTWARTGERPEDFTTLDRLRGEFNGAAPAFAHLIATGQKARFDTKKLKQDLANAEEKLTDSYKLEQRCHEAERTATELAAALKGKEAAVVEEKEAAIEALRKELTAHIEKQTQEIKIHKWKTEAERAKTEREKTEAQLKAHFEVIATLTRLLSQYEKRPNRLAQIRRLPRTTFQILKAAGKHRHWANLWHRIRYAGALRRLRRSGIFDDSWYLQKNPDVSTGGINPAIHYIRFGAMEGRKPSEKVAPGQRP
ncbi:hypothetical protein C5748_19765 [Phyllobacterium phragmitis]|uniref:Sulfotransferase family protein n=1 Tax=Phyllobacterium phragmitis TaxID=2670329 RepID=A0A2S9IME7_9HYPH|nr:hypothetical protein [Phyllobacterium phragmitis]PRD41704.1 hypothetical protein C5748_19765 [Phyllobacterium phragmitis]